MRFYRRQALIPVFERNASVRREAFSELVDVLGLPAFFATHVNRIAHEEQRDFAIPDERLQRGQILADVDAFERGEALRGDAQRVAEGQSDAPFSEVEGENSALYCIFLVRHASYSL